MKSKSQTVTLFISSKPSQHLSQIITGFKILAHQAIIHLNIITNNAQFKTPSEHIITAVINKKIIAFDVLDGYNIDIQKLEDYLQTIDIYYKRSYDKQKNLSINYGEKIRPLGLNHFVSYPSFTNYLKKYIYYLTNIVLGRGNVINFPNSFYSPIQLKTENLQILFMTRLWDSNEVKDIHQKKERNEINQMRISLCRKLRQRYGKNVLCGLSDTPHSRKVASDLILPSITTCPSLYLRIMKRMDICIATTGLHNSIGWKFAEYVAASKSIVSEKLNYELPGKFEENINYITFNDIESCINNIDYLVSHPQKVYEMKIANRMYYDAYARADKLIYNAIEPYLE